MRAAIAGALVLAFLGPGCGGHDTSDAPMGSARGARAFESLTINGQAVVLARPRTDTHKIVMYTHGAGETAAGSFRNALNAPVFTALLRGGYAVVADDAHGDSWGNAASERDYAALIPALERRGLTKVYLLAESMGGLSALQLLSHVHVRAFAGIFPVCSLKSIYVRGRLTGSIERAYGSGLAAALRETPRSAGYPRGLPMRLWASPEDTFVPKRSNTDACAAAGRAHGARVAVTTTRGEHNDPSNFDAKAVLRLFDGAH